MSTELWESEQNRLVRNLELRDFVSWELGISSTQKRVSNNSLLVETLRYVGGVDISFVAGDSKACTCLIVLEYPSLNVVYEHFTIVEMTIPYVAGFLSFRELPFIKDELQLLRKERPEIFPQIVLVDGNGVLHPRGFGIACHLGVEEGICTIGVSKKLLYVDGLDRNTVDELCKERLRNKGDYVELVGKSGKVMGVALKSTAGNDFKQIYVSIGNRISLETAVAIVSLLCKYRIPEPIRQADLRSREFIRKNFQK